MLFSLIDLGTDTLMQLIANFGPLVGVLIFFVWRDWKREDKLSDRVKKLEDYQRETLVNLVEKSTTALVQNTESLKWIGRIIEHLCSRQIPKISPVEPDHE